LARVKSVRPRLDGDLHKQRIRRLDRGTFNGGFRSILVEREVSEIKGWRRKLEASGDPGLQPIAGNLAELE
jgi:hypothetical protein